MKLYFIQLSFKSYRRGVKAKIMIPVKIIMKIKTKPKLAK